MNDIIRTCNPIVRFSKFTLNIKIYEEFEGFLLKLVWRKTLFFYRTSDVNALISTTFSQQNLGDKFLLILN